MSKSEVSRICGEGNPVVEAFRMRPITGAHPLERLNKEIERRSNVVGIFPNVRAMVRLVGAILLEQDDKWAVANRRYCSAKSMQRFLNTLGVSTDQEFLMAIA